MRKLILIFLIILFPVFLSAQEVAKVGTAGAQFLKIGLSARATAMGEAYTVVPNGSEAIFWNPGAMALVEGHDISASYVSWPADIDYSGVAYSTHIEGFGVLGFHVVGLKTGDMRVRTIFNPEGTGEMFTASQFAGGISYATFLTDKFAIGGTFKYVREDFWTYRATNWGVDIGTYYRTGFRSLVLGMSIMNFGPEMAFGGSYVDYGDPREGGAPGEFEVIDFQNYQLPMTFRLGLAMNVYETEDIKVLTALDASKPNDNKQRVNAGVEFMFMDMVALRGGYKLGYDEDTYAFGAGFQYALFGSVKIRLDYSYSDMGILDVVHRGSFGLSF
jgi:opacity protein-like surface antigen